MVAARVGVRTKVDGIFNNWRWSVRSSNLNALNPQADSFPLAAGHVLLNMPDLLESTTGESAETRHMFRNECVAGRIRVRW